MQLLRQEYRYKDLIKSSVGIYYFLVHRKYESIWIVM